MDNETVRSDTIAYFLADKYKLTVEVYSAKQLAKKFKMAESTIRYRIKNELALDEYNRFYAYETYLDAWEAL